MKPKFKIGQKVKVHISQSYYQYGIIDGLSPSGDGFDYHIFSKRYYDSRVIQLIECTEQETSDYFIN